MIKPLQNPNLVLHSFRNCRRSVNFEVDRKMGKLPPSLRSANFAVKALIKPPTSVPHQKIPSPSPSSPPTSKPHYYPKKSQSPKKKPTSNTEPQLPSIVAFDSTTLSDAKTLFSSLISNTRNVPSDIKFYNAILQSFSSNSTLQDSIFFLNHMIKVHPPFSPDRFTYHVLLIQSCKSVDLSLSPVHQVLNLMTSNGFPPNKVSTDIAVRTLCSSGREEQAIELVKELSSKDSPPDTYTYNFIIRHLCKNRPLSIMNTFIKEMREGFDIKPDLVAYTIMIDNVCNSKNLREATRLLGVLSEEGYKPDCYVYNTIMKGYCMLSQGGEVLSVYKKMQEEGVKPDLVTYNTLIYGLSKSGRVKDAKKFLNVMMEEGHIPDAVTYTSLMNGMCREGDPLGAVALLEKMEARGCAPNSCTYNTLLHGLCKGRLLDKGMQLYDVMKQNDMKLETGSYGTFLRALCRHGRAAKAYEVFDYAVESKSLTDVSAYTTLESTLKWLKKAREQGLVI